MRTDESGKNGKIKNVGEKKRQLTKKLSLAFIEIRNDPNLEIRDRLLHTSDM